VTEQQKEDDGQMAGSDHAENYVSCDRTEKGRRMRLPLLTLDVINAMRYYIP
jgi:hypothetical protein